jgi:ATP phosphoribosyltransferase
MHNLETIRIAIPTGRLSEEVIELFLGKGILKPGIINLQDRTLVYDDEKNRIKYLLIRNMDVPVYVEHGVCDLGIIGKDILLELDPDIYELLDLTIGNCKLCVAGLEMAENKYRHDMKIATKYPNITKNYFIKKGFFVEIIKLYGSIEVAPILNLADLIVDLVSTGETLRKNGLKIVEEICISTTRLIANKNQMRIKYKRIRDILGYLSK